MCRVPSSRLLVMHMLVLVLRADDGFVNLEVDISFRYKPAPKQMYESSSLHYPTRSAALRVAAMHPRLSAILQLPPIRMQRDAGVPVTLQDPNSVDYS
ncbi:hypothetical protein VTN49DRAFT_3559 [Thermomyces lanuginosus]|uniref:uncharacterized protein n=1 Tax=Thermomyces lanuginosus TaxID=5541 RepID=UPI0037424A17